MNLLKHDLKYTIEVYPHGWLLNGPNQAIPMSAINEVLPIFPDGCVMHPGIAGALDAVVAIGTNKGCEAWCKQITEQLAIGNTRKEIQWVRGVDCGLSSLSLFRKLADKPASDEADARLRYLKKGDYIYDSPLDAKRGGGA